MNSSNGSDEIHLIVEDESILCKKTLLQSNSAYFEAMFRDEFIEKSKSEIRIFGVDRLSVKNILEFYRDGRESSPKLTEKNIFSMLQASDMLQFERVREACFQFLKENLRISNAVKIMCETEMFSSSDPVHRMAKNIVYANFKACFKRTDVLRELSFRQLRDVADCDYVIVNTELDVFDVLRRWIDEDRANRIVHTAELMSCLRLDDMSANEIDTVMASFDKNESVQKVFLRKRTTTFKRKPPFYPCVVGRVIRREENDQKKIRDPLLFKFDPETKDLTPILPLSKAFDGIVEASGYKISVHGGTDVLITGGEFVLGRSNWNKSLWSFDTLSMKWSFLMNLTDPTRHHSVCSIDHKLYLIGGYGKHRLVLSSVTVIDLIHKTVETLSDLPVPMYSPAVCEFGKTTIFAIKSEICSYDVEIDRWIKFSDVNVPPNIEFNNAMVIEDSIYLTGVHFRDLYCFKPRDRTLTAIGQFQNEAQNTCLVRGIIYSFTTDHFEDKSYIECCDIKTHKFTLIWEKETDDFDFSPYFSIGCFPLLQF